MTRFHSRGQAGERDFCDHDRARVRFAVDPALAVDYGQPVRQPDQPLPPISRRQPPPPDNDGRYAAASLLVGVAELLARVAPTALASQPFAVEEMRAGQFDADARPAEAWIASR